MSKPIVLAFTKFFLPGYKAGGPVRTLANMADHLGCDLDIRVVTQDRDVDDLVAYPDIDMAEWIQRGGAQVKYLPRSRISLRELVRITKEIKPDLIYLNSFFDRLFTLRVLSLRKFGVLSGVPVILAPRGEFSAAALSIKSWRKSIYLAVGRWVDLHRGIRWQASSDFEKRDILRTMTHVRNCSVVVAADLATAEEWDYEPVRSRTLGEPLRICFLSRISQMKNLDFALSCLSNVKARVVFNIFGPREDKRYWDICEAIRVSLPDNVEVHYCGEVAHHDVAMVLAEHDLFFLPTRGENYGHVIHEALSAGLPVLISDQTPWLELEHHKVGWALSLADPQAFCALIDRVATWSTTEHEEARRNARAYARCKASDDNVLFANRELFISTFNCTKQA